MPLEKAQACIGTLQQWGYQVKTGSTLGSSSNNYFSGTDEERLADLQQMLDDDNIRAILCPSMHAPMAAAFNDGQSSNEYVLSLQQALEGRKALYQCMPHPLNHPGKATGRLVGGNLCLLAHLIGTSSDYRTRDRILFIEDVGEYIYSADRFLWQLKRSGKLSNLAGLIIGGFTDSKDTERPFGKSAYEMVHDIVKEYKYPICFDFPVSHDKENYALKTGLKYSLQISKENTVLREL